MTLPLVGAVARFFIRGSGAGDVDRQFRIIGNELGRMRADLRQLSAAISGLAMAQQPIGAVADAMPSPVVPDAPAAAEPDLPQHARQMHRRLVQALSRN